MIKKVKEIRHFKFKTSIFKNFKFDTDELLDKAFSFEKALMKLPKFIKDSQDLENTF
jgi:hypothetical protein